MTIARTVCRLVRLHQTELAQQRCVVAAVLVGGALLQLGRVQLDRGLDQPLELGLVR
jgi:hypothetical protein